ncbi:MAG: TOBE domain-containing protein, partial [Burkholderiales bacterium]|nr:TOBE domain-containing protein [Burkholderiales bacterium]
HRALWQALAARAPAAAQRVGLRPEHLALGPAGQGIAARVELAEHLGDASIVHLSVEGLPELLAAKVGTGRERVGADERVGIVPDAAWAMAFDGAGRRLD